jgi:REP element-mobilizing transposase RayT
LPLIAIERPFTFDDCRFDVFHIIFRLHDRKFLLNDDDKEFLLKVGCAYEALLGVYVLTHGVMSNHFHLLVRVPHRPADLDLPLEVVVARMERALGEDAMGLLRKQWGFWRRAGLDSLIKEWRQKQIARMFFPQ